MVPLTRLQTPEIYKPKTLKLPPSQTQVLLHSLYKEVEATMVQWIWDVFNCLRGPAICLWNFAGGYVTSCDENIETLQNEAGRLLNRMEEMQTRLDAAALENPVEATGEVQRWMAMTAKLQDDAGRMIVAYSRRVTVECMCDISPNVCASYRYSMKASQMIDRARYLYDNIPLVVDEGLPPCRHVERPSVHMFCRVSELAQLQKYAADDVVSIIGIYGMGGVGKTVLLDKFYNESPLRHTHLMTVVDMDGCRTVKDTQIKIMGKLGMSVTEEENEAARASRLTEYLRNRPYVLILDHAWEEVDLGAVGVPMGEGQRWSKVIVATRMECVCNMMGAGKAKIQVKCLDAGEAWSLFAEMAGRARIESDRAIRDQAEMLVEKCGGLPCALVAIGQAMAVNDTPATWEHARTQLENAPLEILGMEKVHDRLKRSYDNLADDGLKICLLYCAMLPEGCDIDNQFYDGYAGYNEGYNLLNILKSASMLEPGLDSTHFKMHPMMRISMTLI